MEIQTIKTQKFEMEYFSFGSGARPFVIIPGMSLKSIMLASELIAAAFAEIAQERTVYVFDSKKDIQEGYSVSDMADDTAEAMDILGISGADVFGASLGGMIAQYIAIRRPELIGKLVLGSSMSRHNSFSRKTIDDWYALVSAGDVRGLNRDIRERLYSKEYIEKYRAAFEAAENDATPEEMRRFSLVAKACLGFDVYDELYKISCPVLVIGAELDRVLSVETSVEMAEKLECECYIYEGYGHAVYDEAPDYRQRMKRFFDE